MTAGGGSTLRSAAVTVIGGGAIGLAAALQLARAGVSEVLVVEGNAAPGLGSTGRANGGVRAQFGTAASVDFSRFTIDALRALDAAQSGRVCFRAIGYLFMAGTAEGARSLRAGYELQRSRGLEVHWLRGSEVAELAPFAAAEGIRAATYCPGDGIVDPHGVVAALCDEGRRLGVEYRFDCEVVAMTFGDSRARLTTSAGDIETTWVVNAAGPSAREVAALAGVDLPVTPRRRNLACTEPVNAVRDPVPMCVDMDTGVLVRREGGGFLIGYSDPQEPPGVDTTFDPRFLEAVATRIDNRFPMLGRVPIDRRKCWAGLYPETPDHHAVIDAPARTPRFIQCAGFGGHGIMHSLAAGQAVAELILQGRCSSFDLSAFSLERFDGRDLRVETAVL
jgi:sarcosine oxidase, subunit beta